jgi:hypothetical protein
MSLVLCDAKEQQMYVHDTDFSRNAYSVKCYDAPMTKWFEDHDMYLHELICLDGHGDQFIVCHLC